MIKKYTFLLLLFFFFLPIKAQAQLSENAEISIVTAGPGEELYEAFGHSAIRIKDPNLNLDLIYNYGVFDFNRPNFYTDFAKGNMIYSLARYDFKYFLASYKRDNRWLKQQILNLSQQEKHAFFSFLENKALPKNRDYLYNPYFDNCATKLRDITKMVLGDKVSFKDDYLENELTFRELTNREIHWNTWGSFGLNLIAGIKLDKKAKPDEYLFLPDYTYKAFKNAKLISKNTTQDLVKKEDTLLSFKEKQPKTETFSPFLIFCLLALIGIFITYKDYKRKKRTKLLDFVLFFTTGLIGCILFFLWFFSSHSTAPNNFNILWAFPVNLVIGFLLLKKNIKTKWLNIYIKFLLILIAIIPILWIIQIQVYPKVIIPLLILFWIRYYFLSKNLLSFEK
ncbi:lipoprotein N-acyltransferase Lnb domain-containing protein [Polaribacter septentrionalilitoris]|uniref:lipoprotein N-acyltransferase Lnb domain-containing protein n=1 Tax=Polaribacter septentrionalilitoris TaxID=2494657 RepID=UPI00135696B9|nr:DUF4105 domain-containing protein [Polaribacter septentrionalilitoris]